MKIKLFSIYDVKAQAYNRPFPSANAFTAQRELLTTLKDPNSLLAQCPDDFGLYLVAEYDECTGAFTAPDQPELITTCSALLQSAAE